MPESHRMARLGLDPNHLAPNPLTILCPFSTPSIPAMEQLIGVLQPSMRHKGQLQIWGSEEPQYSHI